jgi:hypothetical protein
MPSFNDIICFEPQLHNQSLILFECLGYRCLASGFALGFRVQSSSPLKTCDIDFLLLQSKMFQHLYLRMQQLKSRAVEMFTGQPISVECANKLLDLALSTSSSTK